MGTGIHGICVLVYYQDWRTLKLWRAHKIWRTTLLLWESWTSLPPALVPLVNDVKWQTGWSNQSRTNTSCLGMVFSKMARHAGLSQDPNRWQCKKNAKRLCTCTPWPCSHVSIMISVFLALRYNCNTWACSNAISTQNSRAGSCNFCISAANFICACEVQWILTLNH